MFDEAKFNELLEKIGTNNGYSEGQILNWKGLEYDNHVIHSSPEMIGKSNIPALQEIHIFLAPVWDATTNLIDEALIVRYNDVVKEFNNVMIDTYPNFKEMKNPVLSLKFANIGYLTVMQSSLYVLSNNKAEVIQCAHMLANLFKTAGFVILREKIEASIYGINGIPESKEEIDKYGNYFEFHIRVEHKSPTSDKIPLASKELQELENISSEFQEKFGIPIPLSFNRSTHTDGGYQRYLNARFRGIGSVEASAKVREICNKINETGNLRVVKTISEYVWYDTFVDLDKGWIDF